MRCSEIMKADVECLRRDETIRKAAERMRDLNIGFLPICDENGNVLGTLTDRDIAVRAVAGGMELDTQVLDVMSNEVVACDPSDDVDRAAELMSERRKSRIMCIDEEGHLAGVISLSDIAQQQDAGKTLRDVAEREVHA